MVEPPPLEKIIELHTDLIEKCGPIFYPVHEARVVGWCDIFPFKNPRLCHRGGLGIGMYSDFRRKGTGSLLVRETLIKAKQFGLEKVELNVYTENIAAIALYRKLDGKYFDCLSMAKFL